MNTITIANQTYPCRQTMGAFLRYKHETGKEATEIKGNLTDMLTFIFCCVQSACAADGIDFQYTDGKKNYPYTLQAFADRVSIDDINKWANDMQQAAADNEKKKR